MFSRRRIMIVGAGGHGRIVADLAERIGYGEIVFIDQSWPELVQNLSWPVIAAEIPEDLTDWSVAVAIGRNNVRLDTLRKLKSRGADLPNLLHPSATVSDHASLGVGVLIAAQAVVGVGSVIGDSVIINTSASVDHDCKLGDGVHLSPGAHLAGTVRVGQCSWIGIGAVVRESVEIGCNVVVGAGAAVVSNLIDGITVGGVPARTLNRIN